MASRESAPANTTSRTRKRVRELLKRMPREPQFASQGRSVFVDLERQEVTAAYTPLDVVRAFLGGRGSNMWYLYNLLNEASEPLDPGVPLIFGSCLLSGLVPSAARGNCSSGSPESHVIMDSNAGDYVPSFMRLAGFAHIILYGHSPKPVVVVFRDGELQPEWRDASAYVGMDNIDFREKVEGDLGGRWTRDLAMASVTGAGERGVLVSGIMAGPKAIFARGGPGAKMGSLGIKGLAIHGWSGDQDFAQPGEVKPYNRHIAKTLLRTSVVKNALSTVGTPFLYRPSRLLGAIGALNNQFQTWTQRLDSEGFDPYRSGMTGCFRCPVNCRPLNDLGEDAEEGDKYASGDGPEYVTVGKLGPMVGIEDPKVVVRLNNICNDLGLDTASTGSALSWALELFQRGVITKEHTGGMELCWGDSEGVERLLFMASRREGFGDAIAAGTRAVAEGHYPEEALRYRMAVKGLFQSDPHDARILKAFALGLAVATRGMDHLRNRVTLEINARINDDPEFKKELYLGHPIPARPNEYEGKEWAIRVCENIYAVGDAIGMCRFTTKLFNSPSLPSYDEFVEQLDRTCGLKFDVAELDEVGHQINGIERLINHRVGVRKEDDTLPERWFEEPVSVGRFKGERIEREEFRRMRDRFYELSDLDDEGQPKPEWKAQLLQVIEGNGEAN